MISSTLSAVLYLAFGALVPTPVQQADARIPAVLPHMEDTKTPPHFVEKTAAQPTISQRSFARSAASAAPSSSSARRTHANVDHSRLYIDGASNDALWVRGASWKASFGAEGAVFIPFFGSAAMRSYPISLRVASLTSGGVPVAIASSVPAARSGSQVRYERGGLVEVYDLALDSIEQSFVIASLPNRGELALRLDVESELAREHTADGVVLANERGRVTLGRATVRDACGREQAIESELDGNAIRMVVPAAFLETAALPVTIDPVISVFAVDVSTDLDILPDVAYDATSDHYLTVEEEVFSSSDSDVYSILTDAAGNNVGGEYVDITTASWHGPKVANNAYTSQFMVVAEVDTTPLTSIQGRQTLAAAVSYGAVLTISGSESGDKLRPDIGGDGTFAPPSYYLVTWQRNFSTSDTDIHAALIDPTGANVAGTILVDNSASTLDQSPRISKCDGASPSFSQAWTIVWAHVFSSIDTDVYAAQLRWDGLITHPTFVIDGSAENDKFPVVSSIQDGLNGARRFMVASQRESPSANDISIFGWVFDGATYLDSVDLSSTEPGGLGTQLQLNPGIDCDGQKFALVYDEQSPVASQQFDTWLSTFEYVNSNILVAENHQSLGATTEDELRPAITSNHSGGGPAGRFMAVWERTAGAEVDTYGAVYDAPAFTSFCFPGADTTTCPCANNPTNPAGGCDNSALTGGAQLAASGSTSGDTVVLSASGMLPHANAIYLQGDAYLVTGATFGAGVRCTGGHLLRLALKPSVGGASSYPEVGDLSISARAAQLGAPISPGSQRFYQTYYRDPAAVSCTATFNATSGIVIDW